MSDFIQLCLLSPTTGRQSCVSTATLKKEPAEDCLSFYGIFINCLSVHIPADRLAFIHAHPAKIHKSPQRLTFGSEPNILRVRRAGLYFADDRHGLIQLLRRTAYVAPARTA